MSEEIILHAENVECPHCCSAVLLHSLRVRNANKNSVKNWDKNIATCTICKKRFSVDAYFRVQTHSRPAKQV